MKHLIETGFRTRTSKDKVWLDWRGDVLDRRQFVSASECGDCARAIKYRKLYHGGPMQSYGAAERGHTAEAWALEQIKASGLCNVMLAGKDQRTVHHGPISGTPDGVMRFADEDVLWECKSLDPRANWDKLPRETHIAQVNQNIYLVNVVYGLQIQRGVITYIDAADYEHIVDCEVEFDLARALEYVDRARRILAAKYAEELPAEGVFTGACKFCMFKGKCSGSVAAEKAEKQQTQEKQNVARSFF